MSKFTPGPWEWRTTNITQVGTGLSDPMTAMGLATMTGYREIAEANARLMAAAPTLHNEMVRFLPVIERAEADPKLWAKLTEGTGIATANGYRAAIAKATGEAA